MMCFYSSLPVRREKKAVCKTKGHNKKMRYQTYLSQDVAQLHKMVPQDVEALDDEWKGKWNRACRSKRNKYNFAIHERSRDSCVFRRSREEMEEVQEEMDRRNDARVFTLKEAIGENADAKTLTKYDKWKTGQGTAIPKAVSSNCVKLRGKRNVIYIDNPDGEKELPENSEQEDVENNDFSSSQHSSGMISKVLAENTCFEPVQLSISADSVHPKYLEKQFGDQYIEGHSNPRRFVIRIPQGHSKSNAFVVLQVQRRVQDRCQDEPDIFNRFNISQNTEIKTEEDESLIKANLSLQMR